MYSNFDAGCAIGAMLPGVANAGRTVRRVLAILVTLSFAMVAPSLVPSIASAAGAGAQPTATKPAARVNADLPTATLTIRGHRLVAEIASTPIEREIGLMNRFSLRADHGMLFVFEHPQPLAFWMKNTFIALSVAYVDAQGRILNIEHMVPQDLTPHWSQGVALYAIEMSQGWFLDHGVSPGDRVEGLVPRPARP